MGPKGSQKLAILPCKFKDTTGQDPFSISHLEDLFARRNTGGLNDYWITASLGSINLDGSKVFPWKIHSEERDDYIAARPSRWDKIKGAIELHGIDESKYAGVVAIFIPDAGDAGTQGGVLVGSGGVNVTFLAHETGHVFGLSHSFDESDRKGQSWSAPGEYYDGYDIMSAMNVFSFNGPRFSTTGPLLCTANQDLMGWLPAGRVWTPPLGRSSLTEIDLVSLSHTDRPGYLCAKTGNWFIEFRTDDSWDAGLPQPCVLIHSISGNNAVVHAQNASTYTNEWQPGQSLGPSDLQMTVLGGTRITIVSFDLRNHKARIRIQNTIRRPIFPISGGDIIGGVAVDGGGYIIIGGKIIRIPPRSPVIGLVSRLALISQAEETLSEKSRGVVTGEVYKEIEGLAKRARQRLQKGDEKQEEGEEQYD